MTIGELFAPSKIGSAMKQRESATPSGFRFCLVEDWKLYFKINPDKIFGLII
jgi:hypothetical protein